VTIAQIMALVRDAVIVAAIAFFCWKLVDYGEDQVQVSEFRALQAQVLHNSQLQQQWNKQKEQADEQRIADLASIGARIDAQHAPIIVRVPAASGPGPLPGPTPATGSADTGSGGIDIRPRINLFEHRYETALADCRAALAAWPKEKP